MDTLYTSCIPKTQHFSPDAANVKHSHTVLSVYIHKETSHILSKQHVTGSRHRFHLPCSTLSSFCTHNCQLETKRRLKTIRFLHARERQRTGFSAPSTIGHCVALRNDRNKNSFVSKQHLVYSNNKVPQYSFKETWILFYMNILHPPAKLHKEIHV